MNDRFNPPTPSPTANEASYPYLGQDVSPKAPGSCTGAIDSLTKTGWTKDGDVYTITGVSGGECADIYDATSLRDLGGLAVGDPVIDPCRFDDSPKRLNLLAPNRLQDVVGDVKLSTAGVQAANEIPTLLSCDAIGMPDIAFTQSR